MGCDIHCYVEYKSNGQYTSWGGRINPGRDYGVFGVMAGVRGGGCLYSARGVPDDMSYRASSDYMIYVLPTPEEAAEWSAAGDRAVDAATADEWVASGSSSEVPSGGSTRRITGPDWHTPSWLTADELEKCLDRTAAVRGGKDPVEVGWKAMMAAMKTLPGARVVFWFDN